MHRPCTAACTAAHCEQALGRLRLGVSRLSNFGALHAAGLRVEEAAELLRTAQALRTQAGEAETEAEDGVPAVLSAIEQARREMGEWAEITASLGAGGEAAAGASDYSGGEGGSWRVAPLFARAAELPRVEAGKGAEESAAALWRLVQRGQPVVITGLQQASGFAPRCRPPTPPPPAHSLPMQPLPRASPQPPRSLHAASTLSITRQPPTPTPAGGRAAWSRDGLCAALGELPVRVSVSASRRFDGAEEGPLWGLGAGEEVLVRPPETHMRLRDVMALLQHPTPEAFYVEYNAAHQYLGDRLQAMAPLPPHPPSLRPLLQNLWLGKGATTSPLHYDDYENLLTQVAPAPHVHGMRRCTHPSPLH